MHEALILIAHAIALAHDRTTCHDLLNVPFDFATALIPPSLRPHLAHMPLRRTIGRKGSIALIERTWRSMKQEYVRHLFLHRSIRALEMKLKTWQRWHNGHRPHQGLGQRTPDDVYRRRRPRRARCVTAGTLSVRFLDGDRRLPVLRLRRAA